MGSKNMNAVGDAIPVFDAYRTISGRQLAFFCPHCEIWHYHSAAGIADESGAWHRVAHCIDRESPYMRNGYTLREIGKITEQAVAQHKVRRGRYGAKPSTE